jgi:hypothetical protein
VNPKFIIALCTIITLAGARAGALRAETGGGNCPSSACPTSGSCGVDYGPAELCTAAGNEKPGCTANLQFSACSAFAGCNSTGLGALCYWS